MMTPTPLLWRARLSSWVGYGRVALELAGALRRAGWPLAFDATLRQGETLASVPEWVRPLLTIPARENACVWVTPPHLPYVLDRPTVVVSMWESTRLDKEWVRRLNRARTVIVPCTWLAATFSASGVTAPIAVCPLGIDPAVFHAENRPARDSVFRVGLAGRMKHGGCRKGIVEAIEAFRKAFPGRSDVALEIKCLPDDPVPDFGDPRITIHRGHWPLERVADWYRTLDVFLSASKGEGWGLHLHEAMACGTPCITTLWSGPADYGDPLNSYPVAYALQRPEGLYHGHGHWAVPEPDSLIAALREAEADREACARKGGYAAAKVAPLTWEQSGQAFAGILQRAFTT